MAFSTVRLFLVLSTLLGWYTCSIDFSNAFVQATLKDTVWIHLPRGFRSTRPGQTCLCIKRSLYGLSVAPRLWYRHLFDFLLEDGFKQSIIDPCMLLKPNTMIIIYVDDAGIACQHEHEATSLISRLSAKGFDLTQEGTFSEYLGIKFDH